jgi:SAM-dependent methyltransferase
MYSPFLPPQKSQQEAQQIIRLLDLAPGSHILDLCCGQGRHAIALAHQHYHLTGLDQNTNFLQHARIEAEKQNVNVQWQQGDMRSLPFEQQFDAIINIFTSFGYFDTDEDQIVLQQVSKALKPGGLFLLDTTYQPRVMRTTAANGFTRYSDGLLVLEERHIDLLQSRNEVNISLIYPDGRRKSLQQSIRIYTLTELARMLSSVGLEVQSYYGNLDGSALTLDSRLVILSKKTDVENT